MTNLNRYTSNQTKGSPLISLRVEVQFLRQLSARLGVILMKLRSNILTVRTLRIQRDKGRIRFHAPTHNRINNSVRYLRAPLKFIKTSDRLNSYIIRIRRIAIVVNMQRRRGQTMNMYQRQQKHNTRRALNRATLTAITSSSRVMIAQRFSRRQYQVSNGGRYNHFSTLLIYSNLNLKRGLLDVKVYNIVIPRHHMDNVRQGNNVTQRKVYTSGLRHRPHILYVVHNPPYYLMANVQPIRTSRGNLIIGRSSLLRNVHNAGATCLRRCPTALNLTNVLHSGECSYVQGGTRPGKHTLVQVHLPRGSYRVAQQVRCPTPPGARAPLATIPYAKFVTFVAYPLPVWVTT